MKTKYENVNNLKVSNDLLTFVNQELLNDTNISPEKFWSGFDIVVHELEPKNKELLEIRENIQKKIDDWHIKNKGNENVTTSTTIPNVPSDPIIIFVKSMLCESLTITDAILFVFPPLKTLPIPQKTNGIIIIATKTPANLLLENPHNLFNISIYFIY